MGQRLQITFSEEATEKYLEWAGSKTRAEVESDCEPSGYTVCVEIAPVFDSTAYGSDNEKFLEFGIVDVNFV